MGGYTCGNHQIYLDTQEDQIVFEKEYGVGVELIVVSDKNGYAFLGWFDENDVKVSDSTVFSFTVTGDASYVARFISSEDI